MPIFTNDYQWLKIIKLLWIIYSAAGLLLIAIAIFIPGNIVLQYTPACYSVAQFGRKCFMCGSTRSFILSGKGSFKAAADINTIAMWLFIFIAINSLLFIYFILTNLKKNK